MNDLYQDAAVSSTFSFDEEVLKKALKNIYSKDFHPMTDIEENLFDEIWGTMNSATDKGFSQSVNPDDDFREAVKHNNSVFTAFKVHRMQKDMAARLLDSNGNLKPFEQWSKEVLPIADHQVGRWLKTEYDTAVIRAHQAADWQQFEREKDILPNLKWMPSTSIHPGEDHRVFWGTVRPINDTFWNSHRPGDRWNCKCALSSTDEPVTNVPGDIKPIDIPQKGLDSNPGKDGVIFSDNHPYFPKDCKHCAYYKPSFKDKFIHFFNASKVKDCYNCPYINRCIPHKGFEIDDKFGERLLISHYADQSEVELNTKFAKCILSAYKDVEMEVRPHVKDLNVKNPEYLINGLLADRKGVESEKGIIAGFKKAIIQGCSIVVIDLDTNFRNKEVKYNMLASKIQGRHFDFENGIIKECYVIRDGKCVRITTEPFKCDTPFEVRDRILEILTKLK